MRTRAEARRRLMGHLADLRRLLERAESHPADPALHASISALGERMTLDLVELYARREQGVDKMLHGVVEPALERARNAMRTASARPQALARKLQTASEALSRAA